MFSFKLFFIFLFLFPIKYGDAGVGDTAECTNIAESDQDKALSKQLANIEDITKAALVGNVSDFCKQNALENSAELILGIPKDEVVKLSKSNQLKQKISEILTKRNTQDPWYLSLFGDEKLRVKAFSTNQYLTAGYNTTMADVESFLKLDLKKALNSGDLKKPENLKLKKLHENILEQGTETLADTNGAAPNSDVSLGLLPRLKICSDISFSKSISCAKGVYSITQTTMPEGSNSMLPGELKKVLTDPKYVEGTRLFALKMMESVRENSRPKGNMLQDLTNYYIKSGLSKSEAEDCAWDVLAVIATGGPNISARISHLKTPEENSQMKAALTVIATAIPVLDSRSFTSGHPYSMPANVYSICDMGKPYHFWMTAFLARKVAKSGNIDGAAPAAFVVQKGYEMVARTGKRDPARPFQVDTFDCYNNTIRMDLAYSAAAAHFGVASAQGLEDKVRFNVDEGVKEIVKAAKVTPKMEPEKANKYWEKYWGYSAYNQWHEIFAPNSAYDNMDAQYKKSKE